MTHPHVPADLAATFVRLFQSISQKIKGAVKRLLRKEISREARWNTTAHVEVPENERLSFFPDFFGSRLMLRGEALVYAWLRRLSKDYDGGLWLFYIVSNGARYMAPASKQRHRLLVPGNGFDDEVSADAAGIIATLFALGQLAAENYEKDEGDALIEHYHALREFAGQHAEAAPILAAID